MDKVGGVLEKLVERWGLKRKLSEQGVFAVWDACVGETVARHAQPVSIRKGELLVHVSDSVHQHEYHFMRADFVKKLNHVLGRGVVTEIRLRVGEVKPRPQPPPAPSTSRPLLLEAKVLNAIEEAVAPIKDEELRETVRRYLMAAARPGKDQQKI